MKKKMMICSSSSIVCVLLVVAFAVVFRIGDAKGIINYRSIYVDPLGGSSSFKTIQAAVDSVPWYNTNWTCIHIKKGVYREQIIIPREKPFIYLKGEGKRNTKVEWDAHDSIATSATFTSQADYTVAKSITFVNSYNYNPNNPVRPALAALIQGDKSGFYRCGFMGYQDTLWDVQGRHYFKQCTIQGAVDFIFGSGQSLYEGCTISVVPAGGGPGYITAQSRGSDQETNGFVFNNCNIVGRGQAYLGRAWRDHARVLFYRTSMSQIVVPQGWDAWSSTGGHEYQLTFAEEGCRGLGSNTSGRVKWLKKLSQSELEHLTSFSFIDDEGWVTRLASDLFTA